MTHYADGQYDRTKPWQKPPAWSYLRPNATNEDRLTQQALDANTEPGVDLVDMVRPNIASLSLFPPRFGYRNRALGIADLVQIDRTYPQAIPENSDGAPGGTGTSRFAQATW